MSERPLIDRHIEEWAWFLIAVGAVLRFQGLQWDQLLLFNPDERNIAMAAAQLSFPDGIIAHFHAYNGLALYLPRLLAELLAPWTGRDGADPAAIVFAGRLISATSATLVLPVLWSLARSTVGLRCALACLACAVFAPALIQSAHFATTESALILCVASILWLCERHLSGRLALTAFAVLVGIAIGIGFGLKTTALVFSICPLVAVAITTVARGRIWPALRAGAIAVAIVTILALVTTPQIWATPWDYLDTMRFERGVVVGTMDVFWTYQFVGARNVLFELSQLPWLIGPVAAPLALAGLGALLVGIRRRQEQALRLAPAVGFALVYAGIVFGWHAKFVRYLTPLIPVLFLFCGYFLSQISGRHVRMAVTLLAVLSTGAAGLVQAAIYQHRDPRLAAWDWMLPLLKPNDRILVEPNDIGPPFWIPAETPLEISTLPLLEPSSPDKLDTMVGLLESGQWMVVASRRHHSVLPRLTARFPEMCAYYDALWSGRLGYQAIAKFRRRPAVPEWLDAETQAEETFTVFDSPEVIILRKAVQLPAAPMKDIILSGAPGCPGH